MESSTLYFCIVPEYKRLSQKTKRDLIFRAYDEGFRCFNNSSLKDEIIEALLVKWYGGEALGVAEKVKRDKIIQKAIDIINASLSIIEYPHITEAMGIDPEDVSRNFDEAYAVLEKMDALDLLSSKF